MSNSAFRRLMGAAAASAALAWTAAAPAALVHRYSFNNGTANDSFGSANGTLVTGGTTGNADIGVTAPGMLTLNAVNTGANDDYVQIGSAATAGITAAFTVQVWATAPSFPNGYDSLFSFANDQQDFLLVNPRRGGSNGALTTDFRGNGANEYDTYDGTNNTQFPLGVEAVYTVTYDPAANAGAGLATVYLNGTAISTGSGGSIANFNLAAISNGGVFDAIGGHGPYGDQSFNGAIDEFRLYNNALSAGDVAYTVGIGPNAVPEPASIGLIAAVVAGAGLRRRRRTA